VIAALAEHVDLRELTAWDCASGNGDMAEALRLQGCARVYASDIVDRGAGQDEVLDFISAQMPKLDRPLDLICTNPPFGQSGRLATAFLEAGLSRIRQHRGILAELPI
jgi:predicted RNA methylase